MKFGTQPRKPLMKYGIGSPATMTAPRKMCRRSAKRIENMRKSIMNAQLNAMAVKISV
jgi:hypothetical protein